MGTEREKDKELLGREKARELLTEAWSTFWSGSRALNNSEIRNRKIRGVLERLSPADIEYFLNEEEGKDSPLAQIREEAKVLARTGKKDTLSTGEELHIRRQKAERAHGTNPKRIH